MKRLEAEWLVFREMHVPKEASAMQLGATRRAFYSGAGAIFAIMTAMLDPNNPDATDADLGKMDDLYTELKEFRG
jgi:hypothetical protein